MESPKPVPFPEAFVVKNGSKIRFRTLSSIPTPVSVTEMKAYSPNCPYPWDLMNSASMTMRPVAMTSAPPSGMASRAFTARFVTTRSRRRCLP